MVWFPDEQWDIGVDNTLESAGAANFVMVTLDIVRCIVVLKVWHDATAVLVLHSDTMHSL